jgi:hypothetical protein
LEDVVSAAFDRPSVAVYFTGSDVEKFRIVSSEFDIDEEPIRTGFRSV